MTVDEVLTEVRRQCSLSGARKVILYGSRAKGTACPHSDIDIAVTGVTDVEDLRERLAQIPTLYTIDLVDLDTCRNDLLKEDIEEYGREI